jgi:hypothetical protein
MDKTLEAEDITLLKHLLGIELRRLCEDNPIDIAMYMGVDGRIFTSQIPQILNPSQFYMLNLVKGNLTHICGQLRSQNLNISIQQFDRGMLVISSVGANAFLVSIITDDIGFSNIQGTLDRIMVASTVLKHISDVKPMSDKALEGYPAEVSKELKKLSRLLFKEKFEYTKDYKKNLEILNLIKNKLKSVVGVGNVEEIVTLVFNEMGTTAPYMKDKQWIPFIEKVISDHVERLRGDIIADECRRTWIPEIQKKLKTFL